MPQTSGLEPTERAAPKPVAGSSDPGLKRVAGSLINVGGFAGVLIVFFLTRHFRWGFIVGIATLWFLWHIARPAAARWTRAPRAEDHAEAGE